ncbi:PAS domain-containing protein [Aphanothece sacrum FPU1]|uniref:Circadian input-output histidine kinase CikA n=2 Tax=Aphanothece sacrum TaxID=1122 RepID=A0A401ICE6_APHSA|nr:PAS domain-containing protein [Aphanothece sacrum FPU1]GBF83135.1 PAS domain-containing protein [Aphanothece sacrum FPU3]
MIKFFPFPLRFSIPLILILCGSLFGITSFNQEITENYQRKEINAKNYVQIITGQTARILDYLYRRSDIEESELSIISQLGSHTNINLVMVMDDRNIVRISNLYELKDSLFSKTAAAAYTSQLTTVREKLAGEVFLSQDKNKLVAIYPVLLEVLPNEIRPSRVGILFVEYDLTSAKQQAYNDAFGRSVVFNVMLTLFCLGLWFFFELTLTRRVSRLVAASNSLAEGNLNIRSGLSGSDELVQISVAFDRMASKIQDHAKILQRQNAILKAQLEASIDGISIVDENRKIVSYNQRICELWHIPVEIVETRDDYQFMEWIMSNLVDSEAFCAKVESLYENPGTTSIDEVILKDGHIFDCYSASVRSPLGTHYGRIWYFRNITERKQSEKLIQQQAERELLLREITQRIRQSLDLETIFNIATEEIRKFLKVDRVGIFKFDPNSKHQHGEFVSESIGSGFNSIVATKVTEHCFAQKHAIHYYNGKIQILDDIYEVKMQECYLHLLEQFEIRANLVMPLLSGEDLWGLLCIHQCSNSRHWEQSEIDFVQHIANQLAIAIQQANLFKQIQKELAAKIEIEAKLTDSNQQLAISNEQLARATRLKDEFLANMSHELRTPLNAILGMSEALQEKVFGPINNKQERALETIASSGCHLLELINDILDVAKIESGKIEINRTPTLVSEVCQFSLLFIKQQASQKRIQIETQIPPNLPELMVDERRIRQVLINLLNNAVKFTPEGGKICLQVTLEKSQSLPSQSHYIQFAIIDNGIGITEENLSKLFKPFVQIDSALNRQYTGTGLGLALVKRIVELHDGKVKVSSEIGVGSCFSFTVPYKEQQIPKSSRQIPGGSEVNTPGQIVEGLPLILLAEDNEANMITISRYLKAKGYRILLAKNGQEAIDQARAAIPDLILMDIQMPGVDGLEATRQIRSETSPQIANLPIIALTALAMPGDEERCLEAGANGYLAKPVKLSQLTSMIQQFFDTPALF